MTLYLDVDNDGEMDMVYVNDIYDEYGEERYPRGSKVISGEDTLELEGFESESCMVKKMVNTICIILWMKKVKYQCFIKSIWIL